MGKRQTWTWHVVAFAVIVVAAAAGWYVGQRWGAATDIELPSVTQTPQTPASTTFSVYFDNENINPNAQDCAAVYPLKRTVPYTQTVATAALRELFRGPTSDETAQGYQSLFSERTKEILVGVKVENNTAYVNLKDIRLLVSAASASCGGAQFFAEVETTLKQFTIVTRVVFALEGNPEAFYEWTQIGCSPQDNRCDPSPFQ